MERSGVEGCYRFLNRVWRIAYYFINDLPVETSEVDVTKLSGKDKELYRLIHHTIKRVTDDIATRFNFNTAISAIMELVNGLYHYKDKVEPREYNLAVVKEAISTVIVLLAPFAPHVAEELWEAIGQEESVHRAAWPEYLREALVQDEVTIVIQINGKVKEKLTVAAGLSQEELEQEVLANDKILGYERCICVHLIIA
ncbi:MAG: class I tRNA ligase family protein [Clostridia bacterium]|nr:class I tRNA ligase family protein [Clostridia bacterium]